MSKISSKYPKIVLRHIIIWTLALAFWSIMRDFGQEVIRDVEKLPLIRHVVIHILLGFIAGVLFGTLEYLYERFIFRNLSFGRAMLLSGVGYAVIIALFLVLALVFFTRLSEDSFTREEYRRILFSRQTLLLVVYFVLVGIATNFLKEIDKKFGRGNLWKMLKGEFYSPKEEEKIFMFLDLKSSTQTAETIGHFKYSKMLQDCFRDLSVVDRYGAEIYQYVGDEAVITWNVKKGLKKNNCIKVFFAYKMALEKRKSHYLKNYGFMPVFKAGMHVGKVITAEIGELKREIAYHGDTINTAARIQEQCNILDREFLISETLKVRLKHSEKFQFINEGKIDLKGKSEEVEILSIHEISAYD